MTDLDFITGAIPAPTAVHLPVDRLLSRDAAGMPYVAPGQNGRGYFLKALYELQQTPAIAQSDGIGMRLMIQEVSAFLADITIQFAPGAPLTSPTVAFTCVAAADVLFFPDPGDPAFRDYQLCLRELDRQKTRSTEPEPGLIDQLRAGETHLFRGPTRAAQRTQAMTQAITDHVQSPLAIAALLLMFFDPAVVRIHLAGLPERVGKPTKRRTVPIIRLAPWPEGGPNGAKSESSRTVTKVRLSRVLSFQRQKPDLPTNHKSSQHLFDSLGESTRQKIQQAGPLALSALVDGIALSPAESKLVDCLGKLLHLKSQTTNAASPDYYMGSSPVAVDYGELRPGSSRSIFAPQLCFTLYELTREYRGGHRFGGKDTENVKALLLALANKKFLISYPHTHKDHKGTPVETTIETFSALFTIQNDFATTTDTHAGESTHSAEIRLLLNPIFAHQIDRNFMLVPDDLLRRTIIAFGHQDVSEAALKLRNYLLSEISHNRYHVTKKVEKLYHSLCPNEMKGKRKGRAKIYTDKAIATALRMGFLLRYEMVTSKETGEPMYLFHLKADWY